MFCPDCGHQQTSDETRFCSRCGLPLDLVTDMMANSAAQLQREKRELTGVGLIMATVIMLLNFLIVFGITTLPHLTNIVFLFIWLLFVISSLVVGGFGFANLIRAGFFKRLKTREARLLLTRVQQEMMNAELDQAHLQHGSDLQRQVDGPAARAVLGPTAMPLEPASVTETTTRELDPLSRVNKRT